MRFLLTLAVLIACSAPSTARSSRAKDDALSEVARADLAAAYLRFDRELLAEDERPSAEIERLNRGFDRLTFAYFMGSLRSVVRQINGLWSSILEDQDPEALRVAEVAATLRVRMAPQVFVPGSGDLTLHVGSMYRLQNEDETPRYEGSVKLSLRFRLAGKLIHEHAFKAPAGAPFKLEVAIPGADSNDFPTGLYELELGAPGKAGIYCGQWAVASQKPSTLRGKLEERLGKVKAGDAILIQALATCRARLSLLSDSPSDGTTAEMLADPVRLQRDLDHEIAAIEGGKDPYRAVEGSSWQLAKLAGVDLAFNVHAPASVIKAGPAPLIIALHGAGGDENMFISGYGAGIITEIADRLGFIVVSPDANVLGTNLELFDDLIEVVASRYEIDRTRIYLVGHSMGAALTASLASDHHDKLAAACCLAGGQMFNADRPLAPTLVIVPEIDGVVPAPMVRHSARRAMEAKLPVEILEVPHQGHTLIVPAVLEEVCEWLLEHPATKTPDPTPEPTEETPAEVPEEFPAEDEFF